MTDSVTAAGGGRGEPAAIHSRGAVTVGACGGGGGRPRSVSAEFQLLDLPTRMRLAAGVLEEATVEYHRGVALARAVTDIEWSPSNLRHVAEQLDARAVQERTEAALIRRLSKIHEANTSDLPAIVGAIMADFDVTPKAGVQ